MPLNLRPFGFTPTESLVYATLLRLGPSTGYAVARRARLARANAYAALEGLVEESAASRVPGRPTRYRPTDPQALLAGLAARQGEALDQLARSLEGVTTSAEPATHEVAGARALANVVSQLVARAEQSVRGVIAGALWRPTLPAWRRAAGRTTVDVRIAGDATDDERLSRGSVAPDTPTLLVIDEARAVLADVAPPDLRGLWSSHPLIVRVTAAALERLG
jgi:sugar-specific transcriptional regulator TrmB